MSVITQAQAANHERIFSADEVIITSSAVLGGFAINAAVGTIQESDFGNQMAFDSYAILLVASSLLDLYAMVVLVVNRYAASRAQALSTAELQDLEQLGMSGDVAAVNAALESNDQRAARRRTEFVNRWRVYRSSAVAAFVMSLPCFLGALAAKQFSVQPRRHAPRQPSTPSLVADDPSADEAAPPPPPGVPLLDDEVEPFTPIRWSLAVLVALGTCAVLIAVLGQMHLLREVRKRVA